MLDNRKTLAIVVAVAALACVGAFAYSKRNSDTAPAVNTLAQPAFGQPAAQPAYNDPNAPQQTGYAQPAYGQPGYTQSAYVQPAYGQAGYRPAGYQASSYRSSQIQEDGYYSSIRRPIYVHNAMEYQPQPVVRETDETYIDPATRVERRNTYVRERPYYREEVRHGRSTGKSVAIVAGTAGVGAAIGAIAGGGKGAGIGALAGGGAGFVYDRMTHNH